jgi:cell division protein FtsB
MIMELKKIFSKKSKLKLLKRLQERKLLKQRNKELIKSRNKLKNKYNKLKVSFDKLATEKRIIEVELKKN